LKINNLDRVFLYQIVHNDGALFKYIPYKHQKHKIPDNDTTQFIKNTSDKGQPQGIAPTTK
jgi:hypothetical protein